MSLFLVGSFGIETAHAETSAQTRGRQIAKQADDANHGFESEAAEMTMTLIDAHGQEVVRKMRLQLAEGAPDRSLIELEWPGDVRGTKLLTWSHKDRDDDQWLYLPSLERVKRITSRNRTGSFMASEFSFEDLAGNDLDDFDYLFLREAEVDGRACYVYEQRPKSKASAYTRHVVYLDKEYLAPVKIEYYNRRDERLKVSKASQWKKYGKYWRADRIEMENVQTRKRSVVQWSKRRIGEPIDAHRLSKEELGD